MRPRPTPPPDRARAGLARSAVLLAIGALSALVLRAAFGRIAADGDARRRAEFERAVDLVQRTFVEPRDTDRLLDGALRGLAAELDPYSRYYDRTETERLERETSGQYDGIGVLFAPVEEPWRILFPLPDSPAEEAGLEVGDRLVTIAGTEAATLEFADVRALLGDGDAGPVELELEDLDGRRRRTRVTPRAVVDPSVRRLRLIERGDRTVGYLSIGSFTRATIDEFDESVRDLRARGARALVIDLRGNLGGVLDSALAIADRFVAEGALLQTESRDGVDVTWARRERTQHADLPVAVLIDGRTASASEVLAGALQDHRIAALVGEPSYGKGTVQTLTPLAELDGVLRVTTAVYRTPSGRLIERSLGGAWDAGLAPDLEVPLDDDGRAAIGAFLATFGPRLDHRAAVERWEERSGLELVVPHPPDPQLDAALALLAGERPFALAALDGDGRSEPAGEARD